MIWFVAKQVWAHFTLVRMANNNWVTIISDWVLVEPGGGDIGLESGSLGGFLCEYKSVAGTVLDAWQSQHEQSARIFLHIRHQHVVLVFTLLIRTTPGIRRRSVAASLVIVPNNRPQTAVSYAWKRPCAADFSSFSGFKLPSVRTFCLRKPQFSCNCCFRSSRSATHVWFDTLFPEIFISRCNQQDLLNTTNTKATVDPFWCSSIIILIYYFHHAACQNCDDTFEFIKFSLCIKYW